MTSGTAAGAGSEQSVRSGKQPVPASNSWYLITIAACPVCGRETIQRKRQTTPRPEEWQDRRVWEDAYDWCDAL